MRLSSSPPLSDTTMSVSPRSLSESLAELSRSNSKGSSHSDSSGRSGEATELTALVSDSTLLEIGPVLPDGQIKVVGRRFHRRNNRWMTFTSIFSMMFFPLGAGPAFRYTGWVPGLGMLTYAAISSYLSGHLLGEMCMEGGEGLDSYPKLAKRAFGNTGEYLIGSVQSVLYFSCGVFNIAFMPANIRQIVDTRLTNVQLMGITWIGMAAGSQLPTYHDTFPICVLSAIISTLNAMLQVIVILVFQPNLHAENETKMFGTLTSTLSALPAISYVFGGHGVFPEEVRELKSPSTFKAVLKMLYASAAPIYYLCSVYTYYTYGDTIQGNVLANWPEHNWVTKCGAAFSLVGTLTVAVTSNQATLLAVENALEIYPVADDESNEKHLLKRLYRLKKAFTYKPFARMFVRLSFVTLQLIVAILLRKSPLQYMQGFMGAFGVGCLTFWAPYLIYFRLKRGNLPACIRGKILYQGILYIFFASGLFVSLVGMFCSAKSLLTIAVNN